LTAKVLIVGDGDCAENAARKFSEENIETIIAAGSDMSGGRLPDLRHESSATIEICKGAEIVGCSGCVHDFHVTMKVEGQTVHRDVAAIVIAEAYNRKSNLDFYGLKPAQTVISLSDLFGNDEAVPEAKNRFQKDGKILFLTGIFRESNPVVLEEVMRKALLIQQRYDRKVYILTGNLKVAGDGLEVLHRKTKEAGIITIKFAKTIPKFEQKDDGSIMVLFEDEIIRESLTLTADLVVVDETLAPSQSLAHLAEIFELEKDDIGFLQSENVHRNTVLTNRRGVLSIGPARGVMSPGDQTTDIMNAVLAVSGLFRGETDHPGGKAEIGPFECARCITCLRICPYKAIRLEKRVEVCKEACEGCGICAAECPRSFITMTGPNISDNLGKMSISRISVDSTEFTPAIVAFCCTRSAVKSGRLASEMGSDLPGALKIIEVPCAGGISVDHMFRAFLAGADGVLLLTCHYGNCHSDIGNVYAKTRAEHVLERLLSMGFEKESLSVRTIAPNMGREFVEITNCFEQVIRKLGPSRIRRSLKSG